MSNSNGTRCVAFEELFIADKATGEAIETIVSFIERNLCGSVSIPNSGKPGYDSSHVKLKEEAWQALRQLTMEVTNARD